MTLRHPAPFSKAVLEKIETEELLPEVGVVIDPFAGIGGVHQLATCTRATVGIEIEPEWAAAHPSTLVGNALALPFGAAAFDAACTSPCYGNRYSDHHRAADGSFRRSYHHDLVAVTGDPDHQLHADNAGKLRGTSEAYWDLHRRAWLELRRVLKPRAPFILNVSDYISGGSVVPMVDRHAALVTEVGFELVDKIDVRTPRMRRGANSAARVETEAVLVFLR